MRLREFDRVGAVASSPFNIDEDGLQFVSVMLGFLLMNDAQLGCDPSVMSTLDGKRFIDIVRNGVGATYSGQTYEAGSVCCWQSHDLLESPP